MATTPNAKQAELEALAQRVTGLEAMEKRITALEVVEKRVAELEAFKKKAEPGMWLLQSSKTILCIFGGVLLTLGITAVVKLVDRIATVDTKVESQDQRIKRLENACDDRTRLLERKVFGTIVHHGRVLRVETGKLVMRTNPPDPEEKTFKLPPDVKVALRGNPAKVSDLKPDMAVEVTEGEPGTATAVEAGR